MEFPINKMLNSYCRRKCVRLHMPSHKGNDINILSDSKDITELSFSDNLRCPSGVIRESENNYAMLFGCKRAFYLVGGSTLGNTALVYCSKGTILCEKNCHISVSNAINFLGKHALTIDNNIVNDIPMPLTLLQIKTAVEQDSSIGTVLVTSPNYYGFCADLKGIYAYLKRKGILLFVDSAHGAHFGLYKKLPYNAVDFCDSAVESTHKTLTALTQTAVILTNRLDLEDSLQNAINLFQTTSPSYLLLASIENAYGYAKEYGAKNYARLYDGLAEVTADINKLGFRIVKNDDFSRVVLDCSNLKVSGGEVYRALEKSGVVAEFADTRYVVCIFGVADTQGTLKLLTYYLKKIDLTNDIQQDKDVVNTDFTEGCFGEEVTK